MNLETLTPEGLVALGREFCIRHRFEVANANLAHDGAHVVSGYPPTPEGEALQNGWELAVMGVETTLGDEYPEWQHDLILEGWCAGIDFTRDHPAAAHAINVALHTY